MLDKILQDLERDRFSLTEGFLTSDQLKTLNDFIDLHRNQFEAAKVGPQDNKKRMESIRGDYTFWLDPLDPQPEFKALINFLESLRGSLNQHLYLGLKQFECHLASYPAGSFYQKHLDRFETNSSRALTFILYLNQEWNEACGGELVVYDKSGNILKKILPLPGSLVLFLSDEFPHEVRPSTRERRSFTGWMHTKIIY